MEGSQGGQIASAAAAGACSAIISGPAELVMIQQQKHGGGLGETAARLFRERGLAGMFRGTVRGWAPTCVPEHCLYNEELLSYWPSWS